MIEISSIVNSKSNSAAIRLSLMITQINVIQLYLNQSFDECLLQLERLMQIETSLSNDYNRPKLLFIRSSELFSLFLLLIHRYHYSYLSIYKLNNLTLSINDFPSYSLYLYKQENQTDPHRIVNTLGIARSYSQMGDINEAIQLYENILQTCSDSTFSSKIDRIIIEEATDYLLKMKIYQTKNNQSIRHSSFLLILFLLLIQITEFIRK